MNWYRDPALYPQGVERETFTSSSWPSSSMTTDSKLRTVFSLSRVVATVMRLNENEGA